MSLFLCHSCCSLKVHVIIMQIELGQFRPPLVQQYLQTINSYLNISSVLTNNIREWTEIYYEMVMGK